MPTSQSFNIEVDAATAALYPGFFLGIRRSDGFWYDSSNGTFAAAPTAAHQRLALTPGATPGINSFDYTATVADVSGWADGVYTLYVFPDQLMSGFLEIQDIHFVGGLVVDPDQAAAVCLDARVSTVATGGVGTAAIAAAVWSYLIGGKMTGKLLAWVASAQVGKLTPQVGATPGTTAQVGADTMPLVGFLVASDGTTTTTLTDPSMGS